MSIVRLKEIKKRSLGRPHEPPQQQVYYQAAFIPQVQGKLERHPKFAHHEVAVLERLAKNVTDTRLLGDYFQQSIEQQPNEANEEQESLIQSQQRRNGVMLYVKIIMTRIVPREASATPPTVETIIELEYEKSTLKAYIQVNDQLVRWDQYSVVIPHGPEIIDGRESIHQQDEEVFECEPCPSNKLDSLLKVVSTFNRIHYYNQTSRNSQHFVREIVSAMQLQGTPHQLHNRFGEYLKALKNKRSQGVPDNFETHAALDHYVSQNLPRLNSRHYDVEYLFYFYVKFHWEQKKRARDLASWRCPVKPECYMDYLDSRIQPQQLLLNGFKT